MWQSKHSFAIAFVVRSCSILLLPWKFSLPYAQLNHNGQLIIDQAVSYVTRKQSNKQKVVFNLESWKNISSWKETNFVDVRVTADMELWTEWQILGCEDPTWLLLSATWSVTNWKREKKCLQQYGIFFSVVNYCSVNLLMASEARCRHFLAFNFSVSHMELHIFFC